MGEIRLLASAPLSGSISARRNAAAVEKLVDRGSGETPRGGKWIVFAKCVVERLAV
jgi:hypothetical protein